jgi:hypothetical protein
MNNIRLIPVVLATITLAGCASAPLVFTTKTSMGLDVSGTAQMPDKVSFSYSRFEGAIVPRKSNGQAQTVYGGLDSDMTFFHGQTIKQTFATGNAAILAARGTPPRTTATTTNAANDPLLFVTSTTFGLDLSAGEQNMSPSLLLGFRRSEATFVPVPDPAQEVRSVYADILINTSENTNAAEITTNFSALSGVRIKQSFATGLAAESLATTPAVRAALDAAANLRVEAIVKSKADQREAVLDKVTSDQKTVDAALLTKLLTGTDGKVLSGTETWVSTYGGKPLPAFKDELLQGGDYYLQTLYDRAVK